MYILLDNVHFYSAEEADERFSGAAAAAEKERAEAAEAALDGRIDALETSVGTNTDDIATNKENITANGNAISDEVTRATNAEGLIEQAVTDETTRATNAEGSLSNSIISVNSDISNLNTKVEIDRAVQAMVFETEADKPDVNWSAATRLKVSDGQLIFVKQSKKWYTATTTSTEGDPVTYTEFTMANDNNSTVTNIWVRDDNTNYLVNTVDDTENIRAVDWPNPAVIRSGNDTYKYICYINLPHRITAQDFANSLLLVQFKDGIYNSNIFDTICNLTTSGNNTIIELYSSEDLYGRNRDLPGQILDSITLLTA